MMANPRKRSNYSADHIALRKKQSKKECVGCGQQFVSRHLSDHVNQNFVDGIWLCSAEKNTLQGNVSNSNSYKNDEQENLYSDGKTCDLGAVRKTLSKLIKKKFQQNLDPFDFHSNNSDESEESADEFWENISLGDLDNDITVTNQSKSKTTENDQPQFVSTIIYWICMFLCAWQACHMLPDTVLENILSFMSTLFHILGTDRPLIGVLATAFPSSLYMLWKFLGVKKDNFEKYVICRKCYTLYNYDDCNKTVEGVKVSATCSHVAYPNHPQQARRAKCGEILLKTVTLPSGGKKLYPFKIYCYKSVFQTLRRFIQRPNFENLCEKWRERSQQPGLLTDVYDGKIWKEFLTEAKGNFFSSARNYGIMLNLDWFQPFDHVRYSVGVLYGVIMNLPRQERFKMQNVMLIGVLPDMGSEPAVNSFLVPLVEELKVAWSTGMFSKSANSPNKEENFKLALICTGCDVPATRKLCGFLGHGATLGCSKCKKTFPGGIGKKDFSGFDRDGWPRRTSEMHRKELKEVIRATTKTRKEKLESHFGIRYSVLCELDYFDPVEMSIIDPMHNLYMGTAKLMIKLWLEFNALNENQFNNIQNIVDDVDAASSIGAIPRKIASSFSGFTAEQWKNWTNIFSIFALKGILPNLYLENWRKFVLASRLIAKKYITFPEIIMLDKLILEFCCGFETVFGTSKVTPNIHLHCHLADCIRNYGPVYSFWLFSFERYNGHLGNLPNNSRSVELQMMRRFTRDAFVSTVVYPEMFHNKFIKHFQMLNCSKVITSIPNDDKTLKILYLSKKCVIIKDQDWTDISAYSYTKAKKCELSTTDDHVLIKQTYLAMYQNLTETSYHIPVSCRECSSVSLGKETFGSFKSRHKRSSYIMAYWHSKDGRIFNEEEDVDLVPGIVQRYILHNLIVNEKSHVHLFAQVSWLSPFNSTLKNYCGKPVEVWNRNLYDVKGASSFLPVQRIHCKYVQAYGKVRNKNVSFVCPITSGIDI